MSAFQYKAVTRSGEARKGAIEAASEDDVLRILSSRGLYAREVRTSGGGLQLPSMKRRVSAAKVALMARQFESILGAGVSVEEALVFVTRSSRDEAISGALEAILADIRGGESLSAAAAKHPRVFTGFFVGMLEAGEATGDLEHVMSRVADQLERQAAVRRRVGNAMVYPSVVAVAGAGLMYAMAVLIVPQFADVVADLGVEVPAATTFVLNASSFLQNFGWLLGLILAALVGMVLVWRDTPQGRKSTEQLLLSLPLFGGLLRQQASAMFASSLAFALESNLEILSALDVAKSSMASPVASEAIDKVKGEVRLGTSVPDALREHAHAVFDPLLMDMAAAGERAGEMPNLLLRAATFFEAGVETMSEGVLRAVEPILIVTIGIAAGGTVVALFSPIVSLTQQVGGF